MKRETEHWRLKIIPQFVRKPYEKIYKKETCRNCHGNNINSWMTFGDEIDCRHCGNTGEVDVEIYQEVEPRPEITKEFIEHMRKACNEYFDSIKTQKELF